MDQKSYYSVKGNPFVSLRDDLIGIEDLQNDSFLKSLFDQVEKLQVLTDDEPVPAHLDITEHSPPVYPQTDEAQLHESTMISRNANELIKTEPNMMVDHQTNDSESHESISSPPTSTLRLLPLVNDLTLNDDSDIRNLLNSPKAMPKQKLKCEYHWFCGGVYYASKRNIPCTSIEKNLAFLILAPRKSRRLMPLDYNVELDDSVELQVSMSVPKTMEILAEVKMDDLLDSSDVSISLPRIKKFQNQPRTKKQSWTIMESCLLYYAKTHLKMAHWCQIRDFFFKKSSRPCLDVGLKDRWRTMTRNSSLFAQIQSHTKALLEKYGPLDQYTISIDTTKLEKQ
ncbi:hypothetical protein Ciccas_004220 [Cichlidogyrus casuarinus]|uniref:Uncharacterized protein n=1 Tax=Cichlidogyrus casuarinus TaxID=1844966 RepID=A0ABD2QC28_9PLAT